MSELSLRLADSSSNPGKKVNEDVLGVGLQSIWILDGATGLAKTPLLPGESDAQWFCRAIDRALREKVDDFGKNLSLVLEEALRAVASEFSATSLRSPESRYEEPTAAMILLRWQGGMLEYAVCGDCRAILCTNDNKSLEIFDPKGISLEEEIVPRIRELHQRGILEPNRVIEELLPLLRHRRSKRNVTGGWWVLGLDSNAAQHITAGTAQISNIESILLMSDGFSRAVDTFRLYGSSIELVRAAKSFGLDRIIASIREIEDEDPACLQFPRLKKSDDATAALVVT